MKELEIQDDINIEYNSSLIYQFQSLDSVETKCF